jgi:hypothetical protein
VLALTVEPQSQIQPVKRAAPGIPQLFSTCVGRKQRDVGVSARVGCAYCVDISKLTESEMAVRAWDVDRDEHCPLRRSACACAGALCNCACVRTVGWVGIGGRARFACAGGCGGV